MNIQTFPALMWHAVTGEVGLFTKAEDVPEGYIDTHPNNLANVAQPAAELVAAPAVILSMTRKEIVKALEDGGIQFNPRAKAVELHDLLVAKVKEVLKNMELEFDDACTDAKILLGLIPPSE